MSDEMILEFLLAREVARRERRRPRCYGISSDALTLYALGRGPRPQVPGRPDRPGGSSWSGSEVGRDYPHDTADLDACELTYEMAPEPVREGMLSVLEEFRSWVIEGRNRYGEKVRETSRSGGMTLRTSSGEVHL